MVQKFLTRVLILLFFFFGGLWSDKSGLLFGRRGLLFVELSTNDRVPNDRIGPFYFLWCTPASGGPSYTPPESFPPLSVLLYLSPDGSTSIVSRLGGSQSQGETRWEESSSRTCFRVFYGPSSRTPRLDPSL